MRLIIVTKQASRYTIHSQYGQYCRDYEWWQTIDEVKHRADTWYQGRKFKYRILVEQNDGSLTWQYHNLDSDDDWAIAALTL